jgi:hypothetical protein
VCGAPAQSLDESLGGPRRGDFCAVPDLVLPRRASLLRDLAERQSVAPPTKGARPPVGPPTTERSSVVFRGARLDC